MRWRINLLTYLFACNLLTILTSCSVVRLTGDTVVVGGKVARETVKFSSLVVEKGAKLGGAGIRYFAGTRVVKLEREGDSYYVKVRINKKQNVRLLLDTGASNVQVSQKIALESGIDINQSQRVNCTLADGSIAPAAAIVLKEVRIGGVKVKDVDAVVLLSEEIALNGGLLGMSFLNKFNFEIDTDRNLLLLRHVNN